MRLGWILIDSAMACARSSFSPSNRTNQIDVRRSVVTSAIECIGEATPVPSNSFCQPCCPPNSSSVPNHYHTKYHQRSQPAMAGARRRIQRLQLQLGARNGWLALGAVNAALLLVSISRSIDRDGAGKPGTHCSE